MDFSLPLRRKINSNGLVVLKRGRWWCVVDRTTGETYRRAKTKEKVREMVECTIIEQQSITT
jgi:hypothetical protein